MTLIFSKRCKKSLKAKKINVSIPFATRNRIWMLLKEYDKSWYEEDDTGYSNDVLTDRIKSEHGLDDLRAYVKNKDGELESTDLKGFLLRGNYPPYVFDALELYYIIITDFIDDESNSSFQKGLNEIFSESELSWRMAEGEIFPIDSHYVEEHVLRKSQELLKSLKFHGALEEFKKARTDLVNGDYQGAIQNANLAVESTVKGILGIEKEKPGILFRKLIDSEIIPEYYEGFLKAFEKNILRCVAKMRNEEKGAGHGQGPEINVIPEELAELGLHLSGVIIHYLMKKHISTIKNSESKDETDFDDDLPF